MDYSLPGSSVHGILQARILDWVAISFSRGSSDPGIKYRSSALQQIHYHLCHQRSSSSGQDYKSKRYAYPSVHSSTSYNSQDRKATSMSINRGMDKEDVVHIYNRLLLLLSRFSHVQLCATPWTTAYQAPPSMGFSRQEYWSGVPLPSPRSR